MKILFSLFLISTLSLSGNPDNPVHPERKKSVDLSHHTLAAITITYPVQEKNRAVSTRRWSYLFVESDKK